MGRVQNCNLHIRSSSHKKLLVILCIGSTDLVKVAIVLKNALNDISVERKRNKDRKKEFLSFLVSLYGVRAHEGLIPTRDIGPFFHPTCDIKAKICLTPTLKI